MGTWGKGFMENDDAADWLAEFEDHPSWDRIDDAFAVMDGGDDAYVEAPDASVVVAAAEVVAAGLGRPSSQLDASIAAWAADRREEAVSRVGRAVNAVNQVMSGGELKELWEESDEADDWLATLTDLLTRLN